MAEKIVIDYEKVRLTGDQFESLAEQVQAITRSLQQRHETLRSGHWIGKGANAFYQEMDDAILPTLRALEEALRTTRGVFNDIASTFATEDESLGQLVNNGEAVAAAPVPGASHIVRPGDTLWGIGQQHGVSVNELVAANPHIKDPNLIHPGQEIVIPGGDGTTAAAVAPPVAKAPSTPAPSGGTVQVVDGREVHFAMPMNAKPVAKPGLCLGFVAEWRPDIGGRGFGSANNLIHTNDSYISDIRYNLGGNQSPVDVVKPGHLVVYDAGQLGADGTHGHVAMVMESHHDHVIVKESSWNGQVDTWRQMPASVLRKLTLIGH